MFDRVRARFGADVVFMDVTAIDAGIDFGEAIDKAVGTCDVLLAIIGPQWTSATDRAGARRLDSPNDFVRLEVGGALKRHVRVVPVLVDDAQLPTAADLPEELQPLLRRNAIELRDARWDADIDQLIASLEKIVKGPEPPLRLERNPARPLRWIAALAVLALSAGAAAVLGPKACAPAPGPDIAVTKTAPPASPKVTVPDVQGKSLADARGVLQRAGVSIARVLYRDDRTKAVDLVLMQNDLRTSPNSPPAVALTVVARGAIVIQHTAEDAEVARGLLGALTSSPATRGLAIRTLEMPAVRPDAVAHVTYSDSGLETSAADVAKDASAWLRDNASTRPPLTAAFVQSVVSRTLVIGLPDGRATATGQPPDVKGMVFADALRRLTAAGFPAVDAKWLDDDTRKPTEVVSQETGANRVTGQAVVVLTMAAKATLFVEYVETDRARLAGLFRELTGTSLKLGILPRLQAVKVVKPVLVGKVFNGGNLSKEANTLAILASSSLTKESGRPVTIESADDAKMSPRTMMFGVPKF